MCWSRTSVPGVMERLGAGATRTCAPINPALIYCAISGLRAGRADEGRAGLRPDHPGPVRRDEHHRRRRVRAAARGLSGRRHASAASPRRSRSRARSCAATHRARARSSTCRCSTAALATMGWVVSNYLIAGVRAAADGQRQLHRRAVGHLQDRGRAAQHRRQQAGAVRGAGRRRRPRGAAHRPALRRARERASATARRSPPSSRRRSAQAPRAEWETIFNQLGIPAGLRGDACREALELPQVAQRELLQTFDDVPGVDRPITRRARRLQAVRRRPDVRRRRRGSASTPTRCCAALGYSAARDRGAARGGRRMSGTSAERRSSASRRRSDWWSTAIIDIEPGEIARPRLPDPGADRHAAASRR